MSTVRVVLDNCSDVCYPGQTITGRVECNFDKQKNLRAVRIKFKGRAETEWHESESYYDHARKERKTRRVRYYGEEYYFNAEYNLVEGGENFSLSAGRHTYPFSYILPPQLPSCYEGAYGNIRYYVKAVVDRPWKFDYEDRISLNVYSPLDLNYLPQLREPVNTSVDKTMCSCWCNDSGALTFNMSLPATGFVPGQEVTIGAHVENMTNVNAENVKFKILQEIEFISHAPSTRRRYDESLVAECVEGGIGAHGEKSWSSSLTIPPAHLPNLLPCSIININYILRAKVVVPFPHSNLENDVPITLGTVPLSGVTTTFPVGPPLQMPPPLSTSEGAPLLPHISAPYPSDGSPYSTGGGAPYLPGGVSSYPPGENVPNIPGGSAPYPPGGSAPYPPGTAPPYAPGGNAPYPPGAAPPYAPGGSAPYPPGGTAPYPSGGSAPYLSSADAKHQEAAEGTLNGFGDAKSPSAPPGDVPYPSGPAPYPPANSVSSAFGAASVPSGGARHPPTSAPASSFELDREELQILTKWTTEVYNANIGYLSKYDQVNCRCLNKPNDK